MDWMTDEATFNSWQWQENILFSDIFTPDFRLTQPPIWWVWEFLPQG